MAAASDSDISWNATMSWLNPANENAKSIARNASSYDSRVCSVARQARDDLLRLPSCDESTMRSKIANFLDSMDGVKSSGDRVKRQCTKLCSGWNEFHTYMKKESQSKDDASSPSVEAILAKLEGLTMLCSKCGEEYDIARDKLSKAIHECSLLEDAIARKVKEVKEAESKRKLIGYAATGGLAVGAVATGGAAAVIATGAKAAAATAGGLAAAGAGVGCFTWKSADTLGKLAENMDSVRGSMSTHLRELNALSDLISSLEKQTLDMAKNIETGHGMQKRYKGTLDKKNEEIEKLKKLLEKQGIAYQD